MAKTRSILPQIQIDRAKRALTCTANARHAIDKGGIRVSMRQGKKWERYCPECARAMLGRDLATVMDLHTKLVTEIRGDEARAAAEAKAAAKAAARTDPKALPKPASKPSAKSPAKPAPKARDVTDEQSVSKTRRRFARKS